MGLFSSIKKVYTRADQKAGGILPGGVPIGERTKTVTTRTIDAPAPKGVIVTDYKSGESVTTYTSDNKITSQSYSPSPERRTTGGSRPISQTSISAVDPASTLGRETALNFSNYPGGLVAQRAGGNTLKPANVSTSAITSTTTPADYKISFNSGLKQSLTNIYNFDTISKQGVGAYGASIIRPFEKTFGDYSKDYVGYNINPSWRGTEFGYGMTNKNYYTPINYQDTTKLTNIELRNKDRELAYIQSGYMLSNINEPTQAALSRLDENIAADPIIKSKYQGRITDKTTDAELIQINKEYQDEVNKIYTERGRPLAFKLNKISEFEGKIFEPKVYGAIRIATPIAETGAIAGLAYFGGSTGAFIAGTYLGIRTFSGGVKYVSNFKNLNVEQKVLGGVGLVLGAYGTRSLIKLGYSIFNAEYRGIVTTDLINTKGRVLGAEIARKGSITRIDLVTKKVNMANSLTQASSSKIYITGKDKIGFFNKGSSEIRIYDPETYKFITYTNQFTASGTVSNIKSGLTLNRNNLKLTDIDYNSGYGQAIISDSQGVRSVSFLPGSKNIEGGYNIVSGTNAEFIKTNVLVTDVQGGVKINNILDVKETSIITGLRARLGNIGFIKALPGDSAGSTFTITSGGAQSFKNVYTGVGASAAATTNRLALPNLNTLSLATSKTSGAIAPSVTGIAGGYGSTSTGLRTGGRTKVTAIDRPAPLIPTTTQLGLESTKTSTKGGFYFSGLARPVTRSFSETKFAITPVQGITQIQTPAQKSGLKLGLLTGTAAGFNSFIPSFGGGFGKPAGGTFLIPFDTKGGISIGTYSNIVKGGKRNTGYIPSYRALALRQTGTYKKTELSKTGLDYRPITKGFKISKSMFNFFKRFKL